MGLFQVLKDFLYQMVVQSGVVYHVLMPLVHKLPQSIMFNTDKTYNHLVADKEGKTFRVSKMDGRLYPPFGEDKLRSIKNINVRESDVFLAGYPKTGAHWMYEIMTMLLTGTKEPSRYGKDAAFIDPMPDIVLDSLPSPRVLSGHLRYEELPNGIYEKRTKIVYTVRNPKDTLVSFFNHHKNIQGYKFNGGFNGHFDLFMEGNMDYGSYFDFVLDWDKLVKNPPSSNQILMVTFEEMKAEPEKSVKKVAEFLGVQVSDKDVEEIVQASSFSKLKAKRSNDVSAKLYRKGELFFKKSV